MSLHPTLPGLQQGSSPAWAGLLSLLVAITSIPLSSLAQSSRPTSRKATRSPQPTAKIKRHEVVLEGTLTDLKKAPLAGVKVILRRAYFPQESVNTTTDAQGRWRLKHQAYGAYKLVYKSKHTKTATISLLLARRQAIRIDSTLIAARNLRAKKPKATPSAKAAKAAKAPADARAKPGKKAPKARPPKQKHASPSILHKHARHRFTPWRAGVIHRLLRLRSRHSRKASRGFRKHMMKRRKNLKSWRLASFRYPWKPFLAQIKGHLMTTTQPEEKHALELMRIGLTGHSTHRYRRKKRALRLMRQYPPTSPAWSLLGYWGFRRVVEAYRVKQLPLTKAYVRRFYQEHPNPGFRLELHYRTMWSMHFRKKFGQRHVKKYRKLRQPIDRRWQRALRDELRAYQGKALTPARLVRLQARLRDLARRYTSELLLDKKLTRYHRGSFYMKRYIAPYLKAQDTKDRPEMVHFKAIQQLAKKHPHPYFAKRLSRATWMLFPNMKTGRLIPPFKMAILPQASPAPAPKQRTLPYNNSAAVPLRYVPPGPRPKRPRPSPPRPRAQKPAPAKPSFFTEKQFRGKHTLLIFWATWCGPCVRKMPMLHKLHKRFAPHGLQMVSISIDKKPHKVHAFRKDKWPIPWTNAILSTTRQRAVSNLFEVASIPRMFLIGPQGTLLVNNDALRKKKQLLRILQKLYPKAKAPK